MPIKLRKVALAALPPVAQQPGSEPGSELPPLPVVDNHPPRPRSTGRRSGKTDDRRTEAEALPPHNVEAEQAVLGSLLIDPDAILRVSPILAPEDFYRPHHQTIYEAALALHNRRSKTDLTLLADELEAKGKLSDVGDYAYLTELITITPTSVHAEYYAQVVEQAAVRRRLITAGGQIALAAYEQETPEEAVERAQHLLLKATSRRGVQEARQIAGLLRHFLDEVAGHRSGDIFAPTTAEVERAGPISTGFYDLDNAIGGLHPSDFILLAARPAQGKTALALAIARHAAGKGVPTGLFSLEMGADQISMRLVAAETKLNVQALRLGKIDEDDWRYAEDACVELGKLPLYVDDTPSMSVLDLRTRAKRLQYQYGCAFFVVDYLQLVLAGRANSRYNREQEVAEVSRTLRALARETNAPLLVLSQLNRSAEHRRGGRPQLSDLRESGSIEQDADLVLLLHSDDPTEEDDGAMQSKPRTTPGTIEVLIAKHRNGPTGTCTLGFARESTRFFNLSERTVVSGKVASSGT